MGVAGIIKTSDDQVMEDDLSFAKHTRHAVDESTKQQALSHAAAPTWPIARGSDSEMSLPPGATPPASGSIPALSHVAACSAKPHLRQEQEVQSLHPARRSTTSASK